jgi:hypothetical protein
MLPRRGFVAVVVALIVFSWIAALVTGSPGASVGPPAPAPTPAATAAAGTAAAGTPAAGTARDVGAALDRVQTAFNGGDVGLLCRPGALFDPAVVRQQDTQPGGCEGEAETLIGDQPRMRLNVRSLAVRGDLATATVSTLRGTTARVELLRDGGRWLLSLGVADDPLPALAGVA